MEVVAMVIVVSAVLFMMMAVASIIIRKKIIVFIMRVMMIFVMGMMMVWMRMRNWPRKRNIIRSSSTSTSTLTIVYECVIVIAYIVIGSHHSVSFWKPQKSFSSILCFLRIYFELFFRIIIDMVENFAQHSYRILLVLGIVLHVGVPHEICQLVGDDDLRGILEAHVEKLHIVQVALLEFQNLIRELLDELVLPQACLNQPFFCHLC